jgi:uncharacterized protein YukJ
MSLPRYGVLVGTVIGRKPETGTATPHYQIQVRADDIEYRVAVNVRSAQRPPDLLYLAVEDFAHPLLTALNDLADGFTAVPSAPGGVALDYIRGNLFDQTAVRPLPADLPGPDNDLSEKIDHFVGRAMNDPTARLYAFGQRWGPEAKTSDKIFGFRPGNGIHDIHMNQGSSGRFAADNGVWQDGGLLLHYPAANQWVAFFLAFQSQAWHTDDTTGQPLPEIKPEQQDGQVKIIGALVNPMGPAPEAETVTLLNTSPHDIELGGWRIADQLERQMVLAQQTLPAGDTVRILVRPPAQLGNDGGLITLLDGAGLKVDGAAYTKAQAREGWTVPF